METISQIPSENIKQEPGYEAAIKAEGYFSFNHGIFKQELNDDTVKTEANEVESDMSPVIKKSSSTTLLYFDQDSVHYCEKCHFKYKGECSIHGLVNVLNTEGIVKAEKCESCSQDSSANTEVHDSKNWQVVGKEQLLQSHVCEAHFDDVRALPNSDCSTESDQKFSVSKMNTEISVSGSSCGLQSSVEIKTCQKIGYNGKSLICKASGDEFSCCSELEILKRTHPGEKPYKSDLCGVEFARSQHLVKHKSIHTGEKLYRCDECGVEFSRNQHLIKHKRIHTGEKPYKCDECGIGFSQKGSLNIHKRTHTGEKPYKCDVCGAGFSRKGSLDDHKRTHTGEKPYKCDVCGVGFNERGNLKRHKRIHTGEKPYKCDVCSVRFNERGNLKTHKRIHTGEKPYKCDLCGVEFAQNLHLIRHKRIHTGEKPYKYDVSGVRFAVNGS